MASQYDYETIKSLAKAGGVRINDLLALAPQNDPFYTGTPTDVAQARWFADVWQQAGYSSGVHLRRVHYWCVSRSPLMHTGEPYLNTDNCWKYLTQASKMARYLGLVAITDIADNKNPEPHVYARYPIYGDGLEYEVVTGQLADPDVNIYGFYENAAQPYHVEIWCEKSTMNDVLLPLCERYRANLVTFEGEVSITSVCVDLMRRLKNSSDKPARIFYLSDFDPAGNSMPVAMARKLEFSIRNSDRAHDVRIKPVVLTLAQVQVYQLPRTPIKDSERRAGAFEAWAGEGAVELDALEALYPGELRGIVEKVIAPYYSTAAATEIKQKYSALWQAISAQVEEITSRYQAEIAALEHMVEELKAIDIDTSAYAVEQYAPDVDENGADWLYDSGRDYVEQIAHYKAHKGQAARRGLI